MRLIDANRLIEELNEEQVEGDELYKGLGKAKLIVCYQPTVDAVHVVRCKDCKWYVYSEEAFGHVCYFNSSYRRENDYCSDGERKTENE